MALVIRLSKQLVYDLKAPWIDRLIKFPEWKEFFRQQLDIDERKAVKTYQSFLNSTRPKSEWSFLPETVKVLARADEKAKQLFQEVNYKQLTLF